MRFLLRLLFLLIVPVLPPSVLAEPIPDALWRCDHYALVGAGGAGWPSLLSDRGDGRALVLVGPAVFAVGASQKHLVVQQHPLTPDGQRIERRVTWWYVIERRPPGTTAAELARTVRGPLKAEAYAKLEKLLGLPGFNPHYKKFE